MNNVNIVKMMDKPVKNVLCLIYKLLQNNVSVILVFTEKILSLDQKPNTYVKVNQNNNINNKNKY